MNALDPAARAAREARLVAEILLRAERSRPAGSACQAQRERYPASAVRERSRERLERYARRHATRESA